MSPRAANRPAARPLVVATLAACLCALAGGAMARSSDRRQPMNVEAGAQQGTVDGNGVTTLSGGVTITQGTLDIRSSRAEIHQRNSDVQRAVLTGSPVVLKQVLDDGSPMTARAAKVDYDMQTEIVVFTGNVQIEQPRGTMSGQRVVYNMKTSRVDSGGEGGGRVKMTIQPKAKAGG